MSPGRESRPAGNGTALSKINGGLAADVSILPGPESVRTQETRRHVAALLERIDLAEAVRQRAVREAIREALACQWARRAEQFEAARPRPGDYHGNANRAELAAADKRCADAAAACRAAADLRLVLDHWDELTEEVWRSVA